MGNRETTCVLRLDPVVISLSCIPVEEEVTLNATIDVCITNKPFHGGLGYMIVTSYGALDVAFCSALRLKLAIVSHANMAKGLRDDAAFTTAIIDFPQSSLEVDVRALDKLFALRDACREKWRQAAHFFSPPAGKRYYGGLAGGGTTQRVDPRNAVLVELPTFFVRTRAVETRCSIVGFVGTHLNVTLRFEGLESRVADLGSRIGDRRGNINFFLSVNAIICTVDGRLQGHFKWPNIMLQGTRDYASMPTGAASARGWQPWLLKKVALNWVALQVGKAYARGEIQLSSQGMLVMNAATTGAIGAKFSETPYNNACIISALFSCDALRIQITYDSLPLLIMVSHQVVQQFSQRRAAGHRLFQQSVGRDQRFHPSVHGRIAAQPTSGGHPLRSDIPLRGPASASAVSSMWPAGLALGDVRIVVNKLDISLLQELDEVHSATVLVKMLRVRFDQMLDWLDTAVYRQLYIDLDEAYVLRIEAQRVRALGALVFPAQGIGRPRQQKTIFRFPPSWVQMTTRQKISGGVLIQKVHYTFHCDFSRSIDVSTDYRDYRYLREISNLYADRLQDLNDSLGRVIKDPAKQRDFVLDRRESKPFVVNPRLNIMGEATAIGLDWIMNHLRIQRNLLPEKIHIYVTDNIEFVLDALAHISVLLDRVGSVQAGWSDHT